MEVLLCDNVTHTDLELTTATTLSPIFNGQIRENANFVVHSRAVINSLPWPCFMFMAEDFSALKIAA
jgi:hypothetical protein